MVRYNYSMKVCLTTFMTTEIGETLEKKNQKKMKNKKSYLL